METLPLLFLNYNMIYNKVLSLLESGWLSQFSVWLQTGRPGDRGSIPGRGKEDYSSILCVQTGSVQWVPGVLSPRVIARPGCDADHSPPSTAEVVNEYELYLLRLHMSAVGLLYILPPIPPTV
jgi:hypothetical protein